MTSDAGVLPVQRDLFEIPEGVAYLNCANMAPYLRTVSAAGLTAIRSRTAPWTLTAAEWFAGPERLRASFARIVGADSDDIALVPSASYGIAIAAANVPVRRGQSIVLLDREFPSNVYAWRELARRNEASVRTVEREPGATWTESLLAAIDDDTAVVSTPNCHWTDGSLVDLVRVSSAARSVGAALVIDGSQSVGAYPIDVSAIRPDFLITVGYKWLLGPYGLGYLYVAPRWREGTPLEHSWLARAGCEDFSRLTDYTDAFRPGARRFDMGEFPQLAVTPMANAALDQILAWGVDRIQATASASTSAIEEAVTAIGATVARAADRVGHIIGIRLDGGLPEGLAPALAAANVYVSVRGDSIRVAPHVYNDEADIARLLGVLRLERSR